MGDIDHICALTVHPGVHLIDEILTQITQQFEVRVRNDRLEYHVAVFAKLL